jgi:hypothetical protein
VAQGRWTYRWSRLPGMATRIRTPSFASGNDFVHHFFMSAGAADAGKDVLYWLFGALIGLCGASALAIFGVGFVALTNLWKELVLHVREASIGCLLLSVPVALLWLAMGLGALVLAGMLLDKLGKFSAGIGRDLLWDFDCNDVLAPLEEPEQCCGRFC